jgi:RNA polymerase sigma-70 factor (ECF subfamily)
MNMNTVTDRIVDEYLVLRCQDGDQDALASLITRWQQSFLRFAMIVTNDPDLAADVVQDAWINIIKALPHLRDPVSFQAWAYRIVNNQCMDMIRKRKNPASETTVEMKQVSPIKVLEDRDQVQKLLSQLSQNHRSVLALHYLQGFDINDIATITRTSKGTVKSRLFNAREKFRVLLEDSTTPTTRTGDGYERSGPTDSGSLARGF